jgi:hypothetical protein
MIILHFHGWVGNRTSANLEKNNTKEGDMVPNFLKNLKEGQQRC